MAPLSLETLKANLKTLTPEQQRELRAWWDAQNMAEPIPLTEDEIEQKLFAAGVIRRPPPPITDFMPYQNRRMIEIKGKPLSETIIEERRYWQPIASTPAVSSKGMLRRRVLPGSKG